MQCGKVMSYRDKTRKANYRWVKDVLQEHEAILNQACNWLNS